MAMQSAALAHANAHLTKRNEERALALRNHSKRKTILEEDVYVEALEAISSGTSSPTSDDSTRRWRS
jgi:histone H3/H4